MEDEAPAVPVATAPAAEDENLLFPSLFGAAPAAPASAPAPAAKTAGQTPAASAPVPSAEPEQMNCPKCGAQQPKRTLCRECGVDMPRFAAAQKEAASQPAATVQPVAGQPVRASQIAPDIDPEDGAEDTPPFRGISFEGRLNRVRYMAYTIGAAMLFGLVMGLMVPLGLIRNWVGIVFFAVLLMAYLVRLSVLRLHDMDRSGWYQLIATPIVLLQGYGAYRMQMSGSSMLFNLSSVLMLVYSLWMVGWPGSAKGNRFGFPNEANTALGYVGAIFFVLSLITSVIGAKQNRIPALGPQAPQQQEARAFAITLYCNSSAAACHDARDWFSRHPRLPYEDCNIETTPACRSEFDRMGGRVVPMLVVGDKKHDGFDPDWLQKEIMAEMMRRAQERQPAQESGDDEE
jgi:uncharacterized membrane protein YhaH (DUF805 family)/ribosomal protein L40E